MITAYAKHVGAAAPRRPRILFVDDDAMILHVLRRLLTLMCPQWEAEFVESGDCALEALEDRSFDVLVTDLEMPRMSGVSLIERVVLLYPRVAPVVYSSAPDLLAQTPARELTRAIVDKAAGPQTLFEILHGLCSNDERRPVATMAYA